MAHANAAGGATVYIGDGDLGMLGPGGVNGTQLFIPEDTFTPDGWPTTDRFVGPGTYLVDIDLDT